MLFIALTGMLYLLGVNVWLGPKAVIDRVSGEDWQAQEAAHPSLAFRDVLEKLGNMVPASAKDANLMQKRLLRAGIRSPMALKTLYGIKGTLVILLPLIGGILTLRFHIEGSDRIAALACAAAVGFFGPNQVVASLVKRRNKRLRKGLPNALDLMVVCVESGLEIGRAHV